MILLAMLLALAVERALSPHRDALPWPPLPTALRGAAWPWILAIGLAIVVGALQAAIDNSWLAMGLAALVLLLCLGPRDLVDDVQRLRAARSAGDADTVTRLTRGMQHGPEPDADHRSLLGALFIQSHERVLAPLLWFVALGPAGAVLYRIASRLPSRIDDPAGAASATTLHAALAWPTQRIAALLFGLAGSLDDALIAWKRLRAEGQLHPLGDWRTHGWTLLSEAANAALDWEDGGGGPVVASSLDATLAEVLRMQLRALLILLAVVALFTAGIWAA
jgi:membrane protein required for beta-lactamase induction